MTRGVWEIIRKKYSKRTADSIDTDSALGPFWAEWGSEGRHAHAETEC